MTRVIKAATGCTMRMADSVDLVELGRSKSPSLPFWLIAAAGRFSILRQALWGGGGSGSKKAGSELTSVIAYLNGTACGASTPAKDTETDTTEFAEWYLLDDRGRQDRDQEQAKGQEEQDR